MLKKLLEALFKLSGGMSMPSPKGHSSLTLFKKEGAYNYGVDLIAPSDGFLYVQSSRGVFNCKIQGNVGSCVAGYIRDGNQSTDWCGGYVPVKKGENCFIYLETTAEVPKCFFVPTVGSV